MNGWIVIDKPGGMSSARVVARVKRITGAGKVGHAGTLDPLATGVLPIAINEATKSIQFMMDKEKTYSFTISFGANTDTLDSEGNITETGDYTPTESEIHSALKDFIGEIEQVPPAYSAIKVKGRRAYDLARKGEAPQLTPRKVTIHRLKLLSIPQKNQAIFEMTCGKGTYVRSVACDLCAKLGACGHISALRRTGVGFFSENSAISLENLEKLVHSADSFEKSTYLLPVETALDDIPVLELTPDLATRLKNGQRIAIDNPAAYEDGNICVKSDNRLVAIAEIQGDKVKPVRVFNL